MERLQAFSPGELESRIIRTLEITDRWGYGLRGEDLARMLYGGAEDPQRVRSAAAGSPGVSEIHGFYVLRDRTDIGLKSTRRAASNGVLNGQYKEIAETFATDLLRHAPFVRSICVSGSLASGGLGKGDDVDFDIVTSPGTKYLVYLVALALGVPFSLRWARDVHGPNFRSRMKKVTCVNVIWEDDQARPFARRDEFLAFELLRALVLSGSRDWSDLLRANPWVSEHFPQLLERAYVDAIPRPPPSPLGELLWGITHRRRSRRIANGLARWLTRLPYAIVQYSRRRDPVAAERQRFLRMVKFPYEFFQD